MKIEQPQRLQQMQAELERVKVLNAELVAALQAYIDAFETHNVTNHEDSEYDHAGHIEKLARAALAKATGSQA